MTPGLLREVEIFSIGHQGDGETADGHYVPYTVPGDRVRAEFDGVRGRLIDVLVPGPARVKPPCPHFGICGGCAVQHMSIEAYRDWKVEQIRLALAQRNISNFEMKPLVPVVPHSRRRATLSAKLTRDNSLILGFQERGSQFIVDIAECHVIDRRLEALIAKLREALAGELPRSGQCEIGLTLTDTGVDMTLGLPGVALDGARRTQLAKIATQLHLARLTVNGEMVAQTHPPALNWGGVSVELPPGAFLQAVPSAEQAMQALVVAGIGNARKAADLFAGCGTFTFPLAKVASITAYEGDSDAVAALKEAARHAHAKPVTVERRDLFRRPLLTGEIEAFDAIVLDPPRAGAKAQCEQIAQARVKHVTMASCSPATFARDARTLIDGGFKLRELTPVDQFLWAAHVELVAQFER